MSNSQLTPLNSPETSSNNHFESQTSVFFASQGSAFGSPPLQRQNEHTDNAPVDINEPETPTSKATKSRAEKRIEVIAKACYSSLVSRFPSYCNRSQLESATGFDKRRISNAVAIFKPLGLVQSNPDRVTNVRANIIQASVLANLSSYHEYIDRLRMAKKLLLRHLSVQLEALKIQEEESGDEVLQTPSIVSTSSLLNNYMANRPYVPGKVLLQSSPLTAKGRWLYISSNYLSGIQQTTSLLAQTLIHRELLCLPFNFSSSLSLTEKPPLHGYLDPEQLEQYRQNLSYVGDVHLSLIAPPITTTRVTAPSTPIIKPSPVLKKTPIFVSPDSLTPLGGNAKEAKPPLRRCKPLILEPPTKKMNL
ncbi:hypothetical protein RCL1_000769 [Eukaryota sp. TZLM3-RCL]